MAAEEDNNNAQSQGQNAQDENQEKIQDQKADQKVVTEVEDLQQQHQCIGRSEDQQQQEQAEQESQPTERLEDLLDAQSEEQNQDQNQDGHDQSNTSIKAEDVKMEDDIKELKTENGDSIQEPKIESKTEEKIEDDLEDNMEIEDAVVNMDIDTVDESVQGDQTSQLESCVAFGLHPDKLCRAEYSRFKKHSEEYLAIRNRILNLWYNSHRQYLCGHECLKILEKYDRQLVWFTFFWLQDQGLINWGFVRDAKFDVRQGNKVFCKDVPSAVERGVLNILRTADLYQITDKKVRRQIEGEMGLAKDEYKDQVKDTLLSVVEYWGSYKHSQDQQVLHKLNVVVIGGGPSGMCAAQHLHNFGIQVTILEARDRVGGRVHSYQGDFSAKVDLGASLITGTLPDTSENHKVDPSTILCDQLGISLHKLKEKQVTIYNTSNGSQIPKEVDDSALDVLQQILDESQKVDGQQSANKSLWEYVEQQIAQQKNKQGEDEEKEDLPVKKRITKDGATFEFNEENQRMLEWHMANLEYGFSAPMDKVSLAHWYADERVNGGFGVQHCMVVGGYSTIFEEMSLGLDIKLNTPVKLINWKGSDKLSVISQNDEEFVADYVIISAPLGVLKSSAIEFKPELPSWKTEAINNLGFGNLNKIVLEFESVFWDEEIDIIGMANEGGIEYRGKFFMFWNLSRFTQKPIVSSLIAGKAADLTVNSEVHEQLRDDCLEVLRIVYGAEKVSELKAWHVTDWRSEKFTGGAYSYMGLGAKGDEYKQLAAPVEDRLFFCGEHTTQGHCDTVGGAILTGLREACRIVSLARGEGSSEDKIMVGQPCLLNTSGEIEQDEESMSEGQDEEEGTKKKKAKKEKKRKRKKDEEKEEEKEQKRAAKKAKAAEKAKKEKAAPPPPQRLNEKDCQNVANDSRVLLTSLNEAKSGDYSQLIQWLQQAEELLSRKTAIVVLNQADKDTLQAISKNLECLTVLNLWVCDLYDLEKQGQESLANLFKLLLKLTPTTKLLQESGLLTSAKEKGADHPKAKNVAHLGRELLSFWDTKCKPDRAQDYRQKILVSPLDMLSIGGMGQPPPKSTPQKPVPKRTNATPKAETINQPETKGKPEEIKLNGHLANIQKEILERERRVQELNEQLEKQQAENRTTVKLPKIREFEQFNAAKKSAKSTEKSTSKSEKSDPKSNGQKDDKRRESGGEGNRTEKHGTSSGNSKSKERACAKSKEQVVEYIKEVLNPIYKSKKITKEDYKTICGKTLHKVQENQADGKFPPNFINDKRRQKIKAMIMKYVGQCRKKDAEPAKE